MKVLSLLVGVFGFAVLAGGQTQREQTLLNASVPVRVSADSLQRQTVGNTMVLRGNVQLVVGSTIITADEADLSVDRTGLAADQQGPVEVELRGRVRLTVPPQ
jgi:lipopolysaccharide export system protein LptA